LIVWLAACAWGQSAPTPTPPATSLTIGTATVSVEIADDPAEREHGLMKRETLGNDQGMLFVYPDERPRNFWMKDTSLPLSIAYLDAQGRIVRIADMTPFDTSTVPSVRPAMYALEVNQGWFTRHAIQVGASVKGVPPPSAH
jgi:uncharacterized membrane protein (UPF0127 family)